MHLELNEKEKHLINELKDLFKESPSHDLSHVLRVAGIALKLSNELNGKRDIIVPACLLHDLGRLKNISGPESALESAKLALNPLNNAGYKENEVKEIIHCIELHDDRTFTAKKASLEAKIVFDADKLDGFGALGIARICLHCGEQGHGLKGVIERLEKRMPARAEKLNFDFSKKIFKEKYMEVEEFLKELKSDLGIE
ncbi:MAG TPA: HD domain-containing protein [archaeon]|nr:HD domain-containing protein [archaeon]